MTRSHGFQDALLVRLDATLAGLACPLRVAQLSDLHVGRPTPMALQHAAVELLNSARPDLTVLTGDCVCHSARYLDELTALVSRIDSPLVAVLGNHDHRVGADRVGEALRAGGATVLRNGWVQVRGLIVVGLDDGVSGHDDAERATALLGGQPALGLSHDPEKAPLLWARGVPLVLSGHTHGGQLHVKGLTPAVFRRLGTRFLHGMYDHEAGRVYVNPGVGAAVLPWRAGAPARRTVALFDLRGEPLPPSNPIVSLQPRSST